MIPERHDETRPPTSDKTTYFDEAREKDTRRFLVFVWGIQLALWGIVGLEMRGLYLPGLRQIIALAYLAFVPGLLLLRLLKPFGLHFVETVLCVVAMSLGLDMLFGLAVDILLPIFGYGIPMSLTPLTAATSLWVVACSVAIWRSRNQESGFQVKLRFRLPEQIRVASLLYLLMLPILAVVGAFLVNELGNSSLLLVMIFLVCLVPICVGLNLFITRELYPMAIFAIALSLAWHQSLISSYLTGWDVNIEYYFEKLVETSGYWNPTIPGQLNSMLSITILPASIAMIMNLDVIWVFKAVYPLFFALVPVALFVVFRGIFGERTAFLSAFFFVAFFVFFTEMASVLRQEIAELFFAVFFMLLLRRGPMTTTRRLLLMASAFSIAVSHYGLSYLFLFLLLGAYIVTKLPKWVSSAHSILRHGPDYASSPSRKGSGREGRVEQKVGESRGLVTSSFLGLVLAFTFAWYMYTSTASPLAAVVNVGRHIYVSVYDILDLQTRDPNVLLAVGLGTTQVQSVQRYAYLALQYLTQFLILVGLVSYLRSRKPEPHYWYRGLAIASATLLGMAILVPHFSGALNASRLYHIALFFLAPLCVFGLKSMVELVASAIHLRRTKAARISAAADLAVVLVVVPYFLFSSGVVFHLTGDAPTSMPLDSSLDYPRFNILEVSGAEWTSEHSLAPSLTYADSYGVYLLYGYMFPRVQIFWGSTSDLPRGATVFLRCLNVDPGSVPSAPTRPHVYSPTNATVFYSHVIQEQDRIYDNSCVQVYQ